MSVIDRQAASDAGRKDRQAFTLVELLVAILIIGILVAILLPAVSYAIRRAKEFRISSEVTGLASAVEAYKTEYGDYPPDFFDMRLVGQGSITRQSTVAYRHIRKTFSRIDPAELNFILDRGAAMDPAQVLVLWLGGLSDDPKRPFTGTGGPFLPNGNPRPFNDRLGRLFEFETARLVSSTPGSMPRYLPPGLDVPYTYFESRTYHVNVEPSSDTPQDIRYPQFPAEGQVPSGWSAGIARPYKTNIANSITSADPPDMAVAYARPKGFQIIAAGLDEEFGIFDQKFQDANGNNVPLFRVVPGMLPYHPELHSDPRDPIPPDAVYTNYYEGHEDNITNFSGGKALADFE